MRRGRSLFCDLCGPAVDQVFADVEDSGGHPLWYLRDNLGSVRDEGA